jgi:hypothetical protein
VVYLKKGFPWWGFVVIGVIILAVLGFSGVLQASLGVSREIVNFADGTASFHVDLINVEGRFDFTTLNITLIDNPSNERVWTQWVWNTPNEVNKQGSAGIWTGSSCIGYPSANTVIKCCQAYGNAGNYLPNRPRRDGGAGESCFIDRTVDGVLSSVSLGGVNVQFTKSGNDYVLADASVSANSYCNNVLSNDEAQCEIPVVLQGSGSFRTSVVYVLQARQNPLPAPVVQQQDNSVTVVSEPTVTVVIPEPVPGNTTSIVPNPVVYDWWGKYQTFALIITGIILLTVGLIYLIEKNKK